MQKNKIYFMLCALFLTTTLRAEVLENRTELVLPNVVVGKVNLQQFHQENYFEEDNDLKNLQQGKPANTLQHNNDQYNQEPSKQGWGATLSSWTRGLRNMFQPAYGEQTEPSKLNAELNKIITSGKEWTAPAKKFVSPYGSVKIDLHRSKIKEDGSKFIVTAPAHDLKNASNEEEAASGGISLAEMVDKVLADHATGKAEVCIPVSQANSYFLGLFKREHWTTLNLKIEEKQIKEAHLYDSKGWISKLYGGGNKVQAQLPEGSPTVQTTYTGHQGLLNNKDCGRFSAAYIKMMEEGQKVEQASTKQVTSFFSKWNLWK